MVRPPGLLRLQFHEAVRSSQEAMITPLVWVLFAEGTFVTTPRCTQMLLLVVLDPSRRCLIRRLLSGLLMINVFEHLIQMRRFNAMSVKMTGVGQRKSICANAVPEQLHQMSANTQKATDMILDIIG